MSRLPRELGRYNGKSERGFRLAKAHQRWAAMIFACFGGKTRGRLPLCEPSVDEFPAGERNKRTGIGALEGLKPFDPCRHGVGAERLAYIHDAGNSTWSGRAAGGCLAGRVAVERWTGALQLSMPIDVFKRRPDMLQAAYVMSSVERLLLFFLSLFLFPFSFLFSLFWPPPSSSPGSNDGKDQTPVSIGACTALRGRPVKYGLCAPMLHHVALRQVLREEGILFIYCSTPYKPLTEKASQLLLIYYVGHKGISRDASHSIAWSQVIAPQV